MLTVSFLIIALLICAFVFFVAGLANAMPRQQAWIIAALCAVVAVILKVFGVGT
jgi:hypothetical protein